MSTLTVGGSETLLKKTLGRCVKCSKNIKVDVVKVSYFGRNEEVIMRGKCQDHGNQEFVISSDARFYWLAKGNPENSCSGGSCCCSSSRSGSRGYLGSNATESSKQGVIEKLSTCLALIEIVDSCNLACPTCFADSPTGVSGSKLKYHHFEDITERVQSVIDRKGHIEILQLSGGEPTVHPDFMRIVKWVRTNPGIDYLLINTNGVLFAKNEKFVQEIGDLFKEFDNIQLYLQFDGVQEAGQLELRGADLRKVREKAIKNCGKYGIPITLAMTVTRDNLPYIWNTVDYGRQFDNVRGVSFQPVFYSGRTSVVQRVKESENPITVADLIIGLNEQSRGLLRVDDFTPLPCGDPNCATIGWLFRLGGKFYSPTKFGVDVPSLQKTLPDRINYSIEDLKQCGCENTSLGDLMKSLEVKESNAFRLFIKPFMDERTWDEDRIDRCCTHVIRPDGKLDSFCRYYANQ